MIDFPPRSRSIRSYMLAMRLLFCAFLTVFFPHALSADTGIDGLWDASVLVGQAEIPFRFEIVSNNGQVEGFFSEGDKKIGSTSGRFVNKELQLQYEFLNSTLTGRWRGNSLVLSHFAGERPVLFEASLQSDGTLDVTYNRLNKYLAARIAEARAKGIPEPPDSARFTSVRNPGEPFQFQFPDLDGKTVSNTDEQFRGKVVLVTIGGTWCPNCRDEAPFLVDLYRKYHARGFEIVSLSFEAAV